MLYSQYFSRQNELFAVLVIGGLNFLLGYSFTFVAFMKIEDNGSDLLFESIMGSISIFTATIGVIAYVGIANRYGRKISMMSIYLTYLIGVILIIISRHPVVFFISRVIIGIATGGRATTVLYTSEIAGRTRRGVYVAFYSVLSVLGMLMTYATQFFLDIVGVGIITAVVSIAGLLGVLILPDSKYWYIIKKQEENAKKSALWFDPTLTNDEIETDLKSIKIEDEESSGSVISCLRQRTHFKNFMLSSLLFLFRTGCGREPMAVYPSDFFSHLKLSYDPQVVTLMEGFVDFCVSVLCTVVIGMFKRRTLMFANTVVTSVSLLGLMVMQYFNDYINETVPWLPLVFIFCYTGGVIAFLFPMVSIISCEIISSSNTHRNTIFNLSWMINNFLRGIYTAFFPVLISRCHINVTFGSFLVCNVLLIVLVKFFIVETADVPLHECTNEKQTSQETKGKSEI